MHTFSWDNTFILPLDSTICHPDLILCSDELPRIPLTTHRSVLASASPVLRSVLLDCCACLQTSIILPGVSNYILHQLVDWLYTGKLHLEDEGLRLEWDELVSRLGIGMKESDLDHSEDLNSKVKQTDKVVDENVVKNQVGKTQRFDSEGHVLKSLGKLTLNEAGRFKRKPFCDIDIFTSDDDSFAIGNEDNDDHEIDNEKDIKLFSEEEDITSSDDNYLRKDDSMKDNSPMAMKHDCESSVVNNFKPVNNCVQCDLSMEEEDVNIKDDLDEDCTDHILDDPLYTSELDPNVNSNITKEEVTCLVTGLHIKDFKIKANAVNSSIHSVNNEVKEDSNETVYEDCEEEFEIDMKVPIEDASNTSDVLEASVQGLNDVEENSLNETIVDDEMDDCEHSYNSDTNFEDESNDESDSNDSSWQASDNDTSDNSDDGGKAKKCLLKDVDVTNVSLQTVTPDVLEVWLSKTGPVLLPTRCKCKGSCVRNCVCRSEGENCSRRCGCLLSKCRWRAGGATNLTIATTELLTPPEAVEPITTLSPDSLPPPSTVLSTPSLTPIPLSASTSMLSTTAKKRNKKKLFTETVGPQEL